MEIKESLIGNTPLTNIDGIFCKCEFMNLTGSIKDRIVFEMLKNVNKDHYQKYYHVLEVTSGNTGISVAALASQFNLKATIVCPTTISKLKQELMWKYGATVINVNGNISDCMKFANLPERDKRYYFLNQFENYYNSVAQKKMALECAIQLAQIYPRRTAKIIVTGIGTGGTLAGLYHRFPNATFATWHCDKPIEGTSDGVPLPLKPKECNLTDFPINYKTIISNQKYLANSGIFVGLSSAANFAISKWLKENYPKKTVLTILVDRGDRYL